MMWNMKSCASHAIAVIMPLLLAVCFVVVRPNKVYCAESLIIERYRDAVEVEPDNVGLRYKLSVALLKERLFEEALAHLLKIKGDMSGGPEIHYYLGMAYAGAGNTDMAVGEYVLVGNIDPKGARTLYELDKVFYNIGITYQREGNTGSAIAAYERSIAIDRGQALAYCRRGELYFEADKYAEALNDLYVCDERRPGQERTRRYIVSTSLARGLALVSAKRYEEALIHFEKIVALDAGNENAIYFLGYVYYQKADYRKAQRALKKLSMIESWEIRENLPSLLQNIAVELQKRDEWSSAEKALVQAIDNKRNDPDLHYLLGYNYKNSGDNDLALEHLTEALRLNPEHHKASLAYALLTEKLIDQHARRGEDALIEGDYAASVGHFNALLKIDPANRRALDGRLRAAEKLEVSKHKAAKRRVTEIEDRLDEAEDYLAKGSYSEALAAFRHLLALDPDNEAGLHGLSIAKNFVDEKKSMHGSRADGYMAKENFYLALKEYKLASRYDPDDTSIQALLIEARESLGELVRPLLDEGGANELDGSFARAVTAYGSALKIDPENREALSGKTRAAAALGDNFRRLYKEGRERLAAADYSGAVKSLRAAESLRPDDKGLKIDIAKAVKGFSGVIEFKLAAAAAAVEKGDYKRAIAAYSEVGALDAGNLRADEGARAARALLRNLTAKKLKLADKALSGGRYRNAQDLYEEVLALDKGNKSAKAGRTRAGRKLTDIAALLKKGVRKYNGGNDLGATAAFKGVLKTDPGNRDAKKYLARIARRAAPKLSRKEVETLYLQGIELYTVGQYVEAIDKWERVLKGDPSHSKALFNIQKAKRKLEGVMDVK
jgi:tetratricopeptide (TPR) repeat protein